MSKKDDRIWRLECELQRAEEQLAIKTAAAEHWAQIANQQEERRRHLEATNLGLQHQCKAYKSGDVYLALEEKRKSQAERAECYRAHGHERERQVITLRAELAKALSDYQQQASRCAELELKYGTQRVQEIERQNANMRTRQTLLARQNSEQSAALVTKHRALQHEQELRAKAERDVAALRAELGVKYGAEAPTSSSADQVGPTPAAPLFAEVFAKAMADGAARIGKAVQEVVDAALEAAEKELNK